MNESENSSTDTFEKSTKRKFKKSVCIVISLIVIIAVSITSFFIFANNQIKEIDKCLRNDEIVLAEEKIQESSFVTKLIFSKKIETFENKIEEAKEIAKKELRENYVQKCRSFFNLCDAEKMYLVNSDAFDCKQEESFGFWIQILNRDIFSGETNEWKAFKKDVISRSEKYSEIKDIPTDLKNDSDIKKLNSYIKEIKKIYPKLYDLVTEPNMTMTRSEFMELYTNDQKNIDELIDKAFEIINEF